MRSTVENSRSLHSRLNLTSFTVRKRDDVSVTVGHQANDMADITIVAGAIST